MSNALVKEIFLAIGLVVLLLGSMFISTGTFPPMVVVESGSMMHDDESMTRRAGAGGSGMRH